MIEVTATESLKPTVYRVAECYDTIQGEGAHAGTPMVLLRLQGCSVGCTWCDTKFSWPSQREDATPSEQLSAGELVNLVRMAASRSERRIDWVLVTGGEPAEQDLSELASAFKHEGWRIALETSGTAAGHMSKLELWDWVCVSPKDGMPGGRAILPEVVRSADELKFVVGKPPHVGLAQEFLMRYRPSPTAVVTLQPLSGSEKATHVCVEAAMRLGWKLSLQQHKLLNLP